jgi:hypothetical protein
LFSLLAVVGVLDAQSPAVTLVRVPDQGIQPQLTIDARGNLHVVYFKGEAAHGDLFYARLDATGQFSKPLQINSRAGSAIATGTMRGGQIAIGRNGRVHVAWHGSDQATPRPATGSPVMYTRLDNAGTRFEPERNIVESGDGLDAGTIAADAAGNVYVAWHALGPGAKDEAGRFVYVARSADDGRTFARAAAASPASTGSCGCCGVAALADRRGTLYLLYRSATETVHRDTYLLTSRNRGANFTSDRVHEWNVGVCPMSTFALQDTGDSILAAWETDTQVYWLRIDPVTGRRSSIVNAPGSTKNRKHPVIAANTRGETLLAWTEGTAWNKGGSLAWQTFDKTGAPIGAQGRAEGVPVWGLAAVATRPDGSFVIVY